ncbi:MAG: hypothetical protein ACREHD_03510 [Pirellulales bacterium]
MGFTVTREGGTKDAEFEAYARLLRRKGVDLANLPRVREPGTGRRWLYVWNDEADARAFADELKKRTRDAAWEVLPVDAPPSEGPLGPIEIQVGRQTTGWTFALHPFSRQMVQKLFPESRLVSSVFIATDTQQDFLATVGNLAYLAAQVAIILTGISVDQIVDTFGGYRVYEPATNKELVPSQEIHA